MSELIDNRAHRIRTLKEIIQQLHRGTPADEVRDSLRTLVRETSSTEIAAMEQELIAGGMPVEEVQSMCDLHSDVLREVLVEPVQMAPPPGHPLDTFQRENEALAAAVKWVSYARKTLGPDAEIEFSAEDASRTEHDFLLKVYEAVVDAGATTTDNVDAPGVATTTDTVDTNIVGNTIITYTATDAAGNTATATRTWARRSSRRLRVGWAPAGR